MRVLGIDPGLRNMGWGVVDVQGSRITHVANGVCHGLGDTLAARLLTLYQGLHAVMLAHQPDRAAVEQTFVNKDAVGTLKLGQARGIALLVVAQAGIEVGEYAPNAVKKAVVGVGHAAKAQIDHMVRLQLPGVVLAGPDAADALAIAICHSHHMQSAGHLNKALAKATAKTATRIGGRTAAAVISTAAGKGSAETVAEVGGKTAARAVGKTATKAGV